MHDHHVADVPPAAEPAQHGEGDPDLLAVGDDHVVVAAATEAHPREEQAGPSDPLEDRAETAGRLPSQTDVEQIGIEGVTHQRVVGPRSSSSLDLIGEIRWNDTGHGQERSLHRGVGLWCKRCTW